MQDNKVNIVLPTKAVLKTVLKTIKECCKFYIKTEYPNF